MVKELRLTDVLLENEDPHDVVNDLYAVATFTVFSGEFTADPLGSLVVSRVNYASDTVTLSLDISMIEQISAWCNKVIDEQKALKAK